MDAETDDQTIDFTSLTADLVSAYVSNNAVSRNDLPGLIASLHSTLRDLHAPQRSVEQALKPPVSIRKSLTPDYLISLEDGRQYRSLKRHLRGYGLTPEQYRAKWGLPGDYPMVAPNYAKQRSELAKSLGLGQMRRRPDAPRAAASAEGAAAKSTGRSAAKSRASAKRKAAK
ncbi:MAG: MucR family transcriptional regulator [Sphingomicrobium sp.]